MANFFSADYWKALYFKAMGGQETAVDPNAMSGSFAGSSSWTGTAALPEGFIAGSFAGASEFAGTLTAEGEAQQTGTGYRGRRPTLGELRDAFFDRLRGRKKRKKDEDDKPQAEVIAVAVPGMEPPSAVVIRTPDQIDALAADIVARVEAGIGRAGPQDRAPIGVVDGDGLAQGIDPNALQTLLEDDDEEARIEAAIAQARALELIAEENRRRDEEEILILLLAA